MVSEPRSDPDGGAGAPAAFAVPDVLAGPGRSGSPGWRWFGLRTGARRVRTWWRRSLLSRVVAATVALGLIVVLVTGQYLLQRISNRLVDSRVATVQSDAGQGLDLVNENFAKNNFTEKRFPIFIHDQLSELQGTVDQPTRYVVLLHARNETEPPQIPDLALSTRIPASSIPADLRSAVTARPDQLHSQLMALPLRDEFGRVQLVQAVAIGGRVDFGPANGGKYELYFIYRLDREVQALGLVRATFIVGGIVLVLLVGAVAWVVTRQVVAPVRQAARTAEQLASGRLDRRMRVRGEDDLARLARAFNEMAASLERQIHQLEELSRVQRRFVSDVSHELRTPLTTIRMAGEVMYEARSAFDPAVARSAELLTDQLDRFESLLGDLLEVSRFDAGAALLELDAADVREVVTRVVEGLRPLAERRGSTLTVRALAPVVAEFDHRRVERVIRNLVGNAIEHGEGRPVLITVACDSEAVAVCVRDHGVGLRPSEQRLVFNRFWRADPARARSTGGTGLGLAIALEDAHLHGGWLQVWGAPGLGANFRLTLPRRSGVVLSGSPLPLVPPDAPTAARRSTTERTPVALVVGSDGTAVVASDGAAAVLADAPSGSISLPPLRASAGPEPVPDEGLPGELLEDPQARGGAGTPSVVEPRR